MINIGWWGTNAKTRKALLDVIKNDYDEKVKILDTCNRSDHSWILLKVKDLTTAECIFVNKEPEGYSYKPIGIECGPCYHDIPARWLKLITSPEQRKKLNCCNDFFEDWYNESIANIKNNYEY